MVTLRRAAVAGSWYPADPEALAREVDRYLAAVTRSPSGDPLAIIAPHAGLIYSGPVAAHAYSLLRGRDIDVAILVGPSHYVGFEGVAIYERGAFETPFGPIPIAEDCASDLVKASRLVKAHPAAHAREHSLEMQLPFLKRVLPDASIVPLVMGYQHRETAYELGDAIRSAAKGRRAVIVASTDLSHYQNAAGRVGARRQGHPAGTPFRRRRPDVAARGQPAARLWRWADGVGHARGESARRKRRAGPEICRLGRCVRR